MTTNFAFRKAAVRQLDKVPGVYVLCDLDGVPIYVGQSMGEDIRRRVQRHLTSARSDIVANRQVDVWEVAYVWAFPAADRDQANLFESVLYHHYHAQSRLMNGTVPRSFFGVPIPVPTQQIQVMPSEEIFARRDPAQRLPRQAAHYAQIVNHFLYVKNSQEISLAMDAHFQRLFKYHGMLLANASPEEEE